MRRADHVNFQPRQYPNGEDYLVLSVGDVIYGCIDIRNGGFFPGFARKPRPTLKEAVLHLLRARIREYEKRNQSLKDALARVEIEGVVEP